MLLEERRILMRNMLPTCTSPKPMRTFSPAISEISVGSPSPPPPRSTLRIAPLASLRNPPNAFQPPIQVKRLRVSNNSERVPSPKDVHPSNVGAPQGERKSSVERVKSFTIDDILGKKDDSQLERNASPSDKQPDATVLTSPLTSERLQQFPANIALPPLHGRPPMILEVPAATLTKPVLTPWDPTALRGPLPVRPFFAPAHLLHYEQRLAWDYQRQLQEHFQLQAQMLRQMSMDPNVIQSEDGSERDSRSRNSTGSACCSPEVNVNSNDSVSESPEKSTKEASSRVTACGENEGKNAGDESSSGDKTKKSIPGDTPLDALFQLSTKNFDDEQDPATLNIFATRPNTKKKRKSRTAFTNHQIFELEKRFLYQKYLSPADRDEIASGLGLSNAQVITWFQNRRAKLKRDMEELKKDVASVKQLPDLSADIRLHQLHLQHQQQQQQQGLRFPLTAHSQHSGSWQQTHPPPFTAPSTTTCEDRRESSKQQDKQQLKILKMMTLLHYGSKKE